MRALAIGSGLALLSKSQRNPMETTTYGTGELILSAMEYGARRIIVGIGGSATNDAPRNEAALTPCSPPRSAK